MKIECYKNQAGKWTWRLKARNGKIRANAAEDYARPSGAKLAARKLQADFISGKYVPIVVLEEK